MRNPVPDYTSFHVVLLPAEDATYAYVQMRKPGSPLAGIGRQRSFRLDLCIEDFDPDDPEGILTQLGEAIRRAF